MRLPPSTIQSGAWAILVCLPLFLLKTHLGQSATAVSREATSPTACANAILGMSQDLAHSPLWLTFNGAGILNALAGSSLLPLQTSSQSRELFSGRALASTTRPWVPSPVLPETKKSCHCVCVSPQHVQVHHLHTGVQCTYRFIRSFCNRKISPCLLHKHK